MSDIKAAATVLTDERIDRAIMKSALFDNAFPTNDALHDFARWIEREVLAQAGVTAEPEGLAQSEKPHDLTIREAFDAVGGWMNGGEMGYPSFGSFEALSIYTTKMIRCFFGNKAWHERNDAQVPAAEVRAVEQRLDEMQAIIRAGSYWNGNEQAFADKTESDVAMLDDLLSDVFRKLRSLAQQSTADKASEVRAAEWISVEDQLPEPGMWLVAVETDDGMQVHSLELNKKRQWMHEGEPTFCHGYYFDPKFWRPLPAAPSTADSANTGEKGSDK